MNVKDVIKAVVDSMKRSQTFVLTGSNPYTLSAIARPDLLYIGQKLVLTGVNFTASGYYTVTAISGTTCTVTGTAIVPLVPPTTWTGSFVPILVFDHGHPLEIVNTIQQYTQHDSLKFEAFPRVCLFHDFKELVTFETQVSLNLVIVTDTAREYSATERYTYSFDPILTPLYDMFISILADNGNVGTTEGNYFKHTKIDRLFWGKSGLYGNTAVMFNDYLDAIEIENLELIITKC